MLNSRPPRIILSLILVLYPIFVFIGFKYFSMALTNMVVLALLILRFIFLKGQNRPLEKVLNKVIALMAIFILGGLAFKQFHLIKLYPIAINIGFAWLFLSSLRASQVPIVEVIARIREKNLSPQGVHYTRQVTKAWSFFFILNGSISLYTFLYSSLEIWTLYNALISYILMGLLMGGEFILRIRLKRLWDRNEVKS